MNTSYDKVVHRTSILFVHTIYLMGIAFVVSQGFLWAVMGFIGAIIPQAWILYNIRFNPKIKDSVAWEDWEWVAVFVSIIIFAILALSLPSVSSDSRVPLVLLCNLFGWCGTIGVTMDAKSFFLRRRTTQAVEDPT